MKKKLCPSGILGLRLEAGCNGHQRGDTIRSDRCSAHLQLGFHFCAGRFWQMEIPLRYFIKQTYTRSIFGFFFRWTGAIGVDQKNRGSGLAAFAADLLRRNKDIVIMVPAEGTRKRVERWRTGFYRIALEANVPIALGYLDYEKKVAGVTRLVHPTGDFEKDMQLIEAFYKEIHPKHPELYNAKIY